MAGSVLASWHARLRALDEIGLSRSGNGSSRNKVRPVERACGERDELWGGVPRAVVTDVLSGILGSTAVEDISVEDPPLEEVIAEVFAMREDDTRRLPGSGGSIP